MVSPNRLTSLDTERRWVERAIADHESGKAFRLIAERVASAAPIGFVWLTDVDWINRSCYLSVVIGELNERGKGLGVAIAHAGLDYAFRRLGLERVQGRVREDNLASRGLVARLGFREEGTLRRAAYKNGEWANVIVYGILRHEWLGGAEVPEGRGDSRT